MAAARKTTKIVRPASPPAVAEAAGDVVARLAADCQAYLDATDPAHRARTAGDVLRSMALAGPALRKDRQARAIEMRDAGMTWHEPGEILSVSFQRAQQIVRGTPPTDY